MRTLRHADTKTFAMESLLFLLAGAHAKKPPGVASSDPDGPEGRGELVEVGLAGQRERRGEASARCVDQVDGAAGVAGPCGCAQAGHAEQVLAWSVRCGRQFCRGRVEGAGAVAARGIAWAGNPEPPAR